MLDRFQEWRDNLPSSLADSPTAEALDTVLELRGHVEDLQTVQLPKGFGRDWRRSSVALKDALWLTKYGLLLPGPST
jgi:hypothetical protein